MSSFGAYSKYYEFLYEDKNYHSEATYLGDLMKSHSPHQVQTILEMGCGTGKLAEFLTAQGYSVRGIDSSQTMLDMANSRASRISSFKCEVGDVRDYKTDQVYDSVISIFHVMSYQNSNADLMKAFSTANQHLKKDGLFIFDFWYGPAVFHEKPEPRLKKFENSEILIERKAQPETFVNFNKVHVNYEIKVVNKKTDQVDTIHETHKMRYFFLPEIEFFLQSAGFEIIATHEWLTQNAPSEKSWGVVAVAQKISESSSYGKK